MSLNPAAYQWSEALGTSGVHQVGYGSYQPEHADHALLWSGSAESVIDLHPTGYRDSRAFAVAGGEQVGDAGNSHAMIWRGSAASALDVHPAGYIASGLRDTNARQQVGFASLDDAGFPIHAMLWSGRADGVVDLHPDNFRISYAWGMNDSQQVGHGDTFGGTAHALLWSGSKQSVLDLHAFVPAEFRWSAAASIDAAGNVYGNVSGPDPGVSYPAIWLAVPEPTGATAFLLAVTFLALGRTPRVT